MSRAIDADGNCLYRAMSLALYDTDKHQGYLCVRTAMEISSNPTAYNSKSPMLHRCNDKKRLHRKVDRAFIKFDNKVTAFFQQNESEEKEFDKALDDFSTKTDGQGAGKTKPRKKCH